MCLRQFKQQAHRDVHVRIHIGDRPYECEYCRMAFKQSNHLRRHKLRRHSQKCDRPFSCDKCIQRYAQPWDLDLHYRAHHTLKGSTQSHLYKCGNCGRAFTQLSNLRTHERRVNCIQTNTYNVVVYYTVHAVYILYMSSSINYLTACTKYYLFSIL